MRTRTPQPPLPAFHRFHRGGLGLAALAAAFVLVLPATAQQPGGKVLREPQQPPPVEAGLRVYLDPETGEITDRPSAEQVEALSQAIQASQALKASLSRSADGLVAFELIGGGEGVFLAGRFRSATVVRRQTDGSLEMACVDRPENAELLDAPAPAATEWVEK